MERAHAVPEERVPYCLSLTGTYSDRGLDAVADVHGGVEPPLRAQSAMGWQAWAVVIKCVLIQVRV